MYYHVQLISDEEKINAFDFTDLTAVKNEILLPHLSGNNYYFNGYAIKPSLVKRLLVTQSSNSSEECVNVSYSKLKLDEIRDILPQECMFDNNEFSKNITQELIETVKREILEKMLKEGRSLPEINLKIDEFVGDLENLRAVFNSVEEALTIMLREKANRKYAIHKYTFAGVILLYYAALIFCIYWLDWQYMDPINSVLSSLGVVVGLLYIFIKEKTFNVTIYLNSQKDKIYKKVYENHGFLQKNETKTESSQEA